MAEKMIPMIDDLVENADQATEDAVAVRSLYSVMKSGVFPWSEHIVRGYVVNSGIADKILQAGQDYFMSHLGEFILLAYPD